MLEEFGKFSGYKVNLQKTVCFPLNSKATTLTQGQIPFTIATENFQYLGINITNSFQGLHKNNIGKLLTKIKADLQRWSTLPLSLAGRVQTIKMNVLPRFLFLFQCLPLFLTSLFSGSLTKLSSHSCGQARLPGLIEVLCKQQDKRVAWACLISCFTTGQQIYKKYSAGGMRVS